MIKANFNFIGKHPSAILIMGGILIILFAIAKSAIGNENVEQIYQLGGAMIGLGVLLHVIWLIPRFLRIK